MTMIGKDGKEKKKTRFQRMRTDFRNGRLLYTVCTCTCTFPRNPRKFCFFVSLGLLKYM